MRRAFLFDHVAVLVTVAHVDGDPPERGARVEVRLLGDEPTRGSRRAAERVVIERPMFRADLFDRLDASPGNLACAHFHPIFDGVEPCYRQWPDELRRDPVGWLRAELADLAHLLQRSGLRASDAEWLDADAAAVRDALPQLMDAVEATLAESRATSSSPAPASSPESARTR
jgi:hypothetical protein